MYEPVIQHDHWPVCSLCVFGINPRIGLKLFVLCLSWHDYTNYWFVRVYFRFPCRAGVCRPGWFGLRSRGDLMVTTRLHYFCYRSIINPKAPQGKLLPEKGFRFLTGARLIMITINLFSCGHLPQTERLTRNRGVLWRKWPLKSGCTAAQVSCQVLLILQLQVTRHGDVTPSPRWLH